MIVRLARILGADRFAWEICRDHLAALAGHHSPELEEKHS